MGINQDWQDELSRKISLSYLSVSVTRFIAILMVIFGPFFVLSGFSKEGNPISLVTGIWLIFSSLPLYLISHLVDDAKKIRVVSQAYLDLQK